MYIINEKVPFSELHVQMLTSFVLRQEYERVKYKY
jgi:hypothetical protein